jgi:hypothetical protein
MHDDDDRPSGRPPTSSAERTQPRLSGDVVLEDAAAEPLPEPPEPLVLPSLPGHLEPLIGDIEDAGPAELVLAPRTPARPSTRARFVTPVEVPHAGSAPSPPTVGSLVGERYRIVAPLGAGGMAQLFRVEHLGLGKELALKIISPRLATNPRMRDLFYREARVMSQLEHPNVVRVTDFGVDPSRGAFIVMELLRGETLAARIAREGPLRNHLLVSLALQIAEGVEHLHRANLIHCDLKSENVFLCAPPTGQTGRPVVKLIDFGLSRDRAPAGEGPGGDLGGTPCYMAPEQIRHEPPQPSMDLYSVGILLYEMATGEPPFMGTVDDVLVAHLNRPVPPLGGARAQDLDPQLEAIILKALEKDPARRQPSMGQLLYELRTVADMLGLASGRAGGGRRATGVARELLAPRPHCNLCPFPTVRVDPELRIVSANAAFLAFVNLAGESLLGTRIDRTRLQGIYPGLAEDLQTVFRSGKMVQRALRFQPASREALSVLVTLVPDAGPDAAGAPRLACGVVIPLA